MQPLLLIIIDGFGIRKNKEGNAYLQADTPTLDKLFQSEDCAELEASGPAVGLPEGYTGNSEVGHLHLGAGRTISQRLKRINQEIQKNTLKDKKALKEALNNAENNESAIHLAGIISGGGIHGHIDHLKHLIKLCSERKIENVYIHAFTDGRDVSPKTAEKYLKQIQKWIEKYETGEIATVMGRYYSMDRDHNWDRTHKAYESMAQGKGYQYTNPIEAVNKAYNDDEYDYFIQPSAKENYKGMKDEDEVIFYNFRADRERQIEKELVEDSNPDNYDEPIKPNFTGMFPYERGLKANSIMEKKTVENTLGELIAEKEYEQLRVAESQKKPHVTFFFNGQRELEFEGETRKFIESDKIKSYDEKPEMHAKETTDIVLEALDKQEKEFIMLNYANTDLVGHTGDLQATIKAAETVDKQIKRIKEKIKETPYAAIITSDHGNCEDMGNKEKPNTSHTQNKIPANTLNTETKIEDGKITEITKKSKEILDVN